MITARTITAHRQPTAGEISFGYGAIHYAEFPIERFMREDGTLKRWIVAEDGLRYYY
ncbi:MAG: hypothetical protein K5854_01650 [Prevotella sp.]|nr:hypothetical protein [Prevotella sp.]